MPEPITPVVAPVATPVAPAPVATATEPSTLNDYAELARKHIAGEVEVRLPVTAAPASAPVVAGQEPSPATPEIAPAEPASNEATQPAEPTTEEPSPADVANWTEGEKKLHGALVKERQANKDARTETRELKVKQQELENKINALTASKAEPLTPAAQPPALPSNVGLLGDCNTFEAVDARVNAAAATESQANRLQNMLNRNGVEPVAEKLKASGVTEIYGTPIAEASADQVGDFLAAVYEGARTTQAAAATRKTFLVNSQTSLARALVILPDLKDSTSDAFKATSRIMQENPLLRNRADWPEVLVKQYLGEQLFNEKSKPAPVIATLPPVAQPRRPAPSAPRTSTSALPAANAGDAITRKMADGTASLAEVQEYARGKVAA